MLFIISYYSKNVYILIKYDTKYWKDSYLDRLLCQGFSKSFMVNIVQSKKLLSDQFVEVLYSPAKGRLVTLKVNWNFNEKGHEAAHAHQDSSTSVTVQDVIIASKLCEQFPEIDLQTIQVGIWGRKVGLDKVVHAFERVEVYRSLRVDPKEARRLRSQKQGVLPSRCRPGYKGP